MAMKTIAVPDLTSKPARRRPQRQRWRPELEVGQEYFGVRVLSPLYEAKDGRLMHDVEYVCCGRTAPMRAISIWERKYTRNAGACRICTLRRNRAKRLAIVERSVFLEDASARAQDRPEGVPLSLIARAILRSFEREA